MVLQKQVALRLLFCFSFSLVVGCAHQPTSQQNAAGSTEDRPFRLSDPEPPTIRDDELDSIPTEMNARVEQWINYFQGRGRVHMERYLARSTRYSTLMKRILKQNGLPEDLIYIALIESGFSSRATSRAAAVGYWQFIRGTGKRYGMEISALVDERRDPVISTQAAAEYFKGLYSVFGSWYLAMASYNVGENRVKREVMNHYTRDFWELARKKRFPKETINYVPKYIAARLIGNNPEKYGFTNIDYEKPIEFDIIKVEHPVNLKQMAEKMGVEYDDLKTFNPKFKGEIAPLKQTSGYLELRVPVGQTQVALAAARDSAVAKVEFIADAGETETYRVRSGDSLYSIARKYKTTIGWLRDTNDLKAGRKLRVGMRLQVPDRTSSRKVVAKATKKIEKSNESAEKLSKVATRQEGDEVAKANPEFVASGEVFYIVQAGDTLSEIAEQYDSSISELRKMNKLSRGHILRPGMKLKVPKDEGLPSDPSGDSSASGVSVAKNSDPVDVASGNLGESDSSHVVKPGENLTTIAKKYGVSVEALQKANNLRRRSVLKVGARIVIPSSTAPSSSGTEEKQMNRAIKNRNSKVALQQKKITAKKTRIHVVRKGENLSSIADRYQVSLGHLREKNRQTAGGKLHVGARLLIPAASANQ
jgi:membrane-bound lytic murein transglycosylase D